MDLVPLINNMKKFGVQSIGLVAPIIREGDDIAQITINTVLNSGIEIEDGDIIGITESVVARAQGNYVTVDEVAEDIKKRLNNPNRIYLYNPIYSRNRFAMILKAFARAAKDDVSIYMPHIDEVGNVRENHPFTGLDYAKYYKSIVESEGKTCSIDYLDSENSCISGAVAINCSMHPVYRKNVYEITLADFCKDKCEYGLLGSNKASEEKLKLFPSKKYCELAIGIIQQHIRLKTGKNVEVMIYGDGCFKDPIGGIWEFADPVVSPAYSKGLEGTPNELKLKNLADEQFANLNGKELNEAIKSKIYAKDNYLKGKMESQGTTPRRYTDLLGSLMDLTSGSGDKGTPIVYVKGYFNNYASEK